MAVRAIRGAVQLEYDEQDHLLIGVETLLTRMLGHNDLTSDDLISLLFTATGDLHSGFPAAAARRLGLAEVPLMCARELDVAGALPRVVRILAHAETARPRERITHVYLGGARALRPDLAPSAGGDR